VANWESDIFVRKKMQSEYFQVQSMQDGGILLEGMPDGCLERTQAILQ
jgi:hypothetical protein